MVCFAPKTIWHLVSSCSFRAALVVAAIGKRSKLSPFREYPRYSRLIEYISGYKICPGQERLLSFYIRRHIHETAPFHDDGFVGTDEAHNAYVALAAADFRERVVRNSSFTCAPNSIWFDQPMAP
jgi:hypothetical protein